MESDRPFSIRDVHERLQGRYMGKEDKRCVSKYLWIKGWGAKRIHQKFISIAGDDADGWFQIQIWLQRFESGDFPCQDLPDPAR